VHHFEFIKLAAGNCSRIWMFINENEALPIGFLREKVGNKYLS
jgi:hypothetical protein